MLVNELLSLIDFNKMGLEKIHLTPKTHLTLKPNWMHKKDKIKTMCEKIPQGCWKSKDLLLPYVDNDKDLVLLLLAVGDKTGAWKRFPSIDVEWNLPHWPCAYPLNS